MENFFIAPKKKIILIAMESPTLDEMECLKKQVEIESLDESDLMKIPNLFVKVYPPILDNSKFIFKIERLDNFQMSYNEISQWKEMFESIDENSDFDYKIYYSNLYSIIRVNVKLMSFL